MLTYQVIPGDSLTKISEKRLGTPHRWPEIAKLNHIDNSDLIYIGQELQLPEPKTVHNTVPKTVLGTELQLYTPATTSSALIYPQEGSTLSSLLGQYQAYKTYFRGWFFVIADEYDLTRNKFVRRLAFPETVTDPQLLKRIMNPEIYGFSPRDASSNVSLVKHIAGRTDSNFISVSTLKEGAPRHGDRVFWIDEKKLAQAGKNIINLETIIQEMEAHIAQIEKKLASAIAKNNSIKSIENLRKELQFAKNGLQNAIRDFENLVVGNIPASAVKGATAMKLNRVLKYVSHVGFIMSGIDWTIAGKEAYEKSSLTPLKKESIRQAGGYVAGSIGSYLGYTGVLAGAKIGGEMGLLGTIEFGPGAVIGGAIGMIVGGAIGFYYSDQAADYFYPEEQKLP